VVKGKRAKKSADVVTSDLSDEGGAGKPEKKRRKPNNAFNVRAFLFLRVIWSDKRPRNRCC
jgi:hypothetical protein